MKHLAALASALFVALLSLGLGLLVKGAIDLIDWIPKPEKAETAWADRDEPADTSLPFTLNEDPTPLVVVPPPPAARRPHAWRAPCRFCGPPRMQWQDQASEEEYNGFCYGY